MRRAIVIGAGLGGLATALRLTLDGWRVTVLEQRERVGGRCDAVEAEGFRMDAGPTLLVMRDVLEALFREAGEVLSEHLTLRAVTPNYRVHVADGTWLDFHPDLDRMTQEVERFSPGAGAGFQRFMREASRTYRSGRAGVLERNFTSLSDYARSPIPPLEGLRMVTLGKLDRYLARFFADRRLRDAFGFQTLYLGMAPQDSPGLYAILPGIELSEGIWFPEGGMASIPRAIARLLETRGATITLGARVDALDTQGTRVTGVRLADGALLPADLVVCNADLPQAYRDLLPDPPPPRHARMRVGASCFLLHLGIEGKVPGLPHHSVFLPRDPARSYREVCRDGRLTDDPFLYVAAPSVTQPELAPRGESLYMLTMAPSLRHPIDWDAEGTRLRNRMLDRLEGEIPDLRARIRVERRVAPPDFERDLSLAWGAPFGFTHHFDQVAYFRPSNRHARLANLYFVGANTHPGGGVPMVLLSAQLVTQRIRAEQGAGAPA